MDSRKIIKARWSSYFKAFMAIGMSEATIAADQFNHIVLTAQGVSISTAPGGSFAIQSMTVKQPFTMSTPWPLTMLAGPLAPPQHVIGVPFKHEIPSVMKLSQFAASIV